MIENKIMETMNQINYGFVDTNGTNIYEDDDKNFNEDFPKKYRLLSPENLLKYKYGVCWDQVELERYLFEKNNVSVKTYFICTYDNKTYPTHTFLVYKKENKYYWFEHSWEPYRGIHEFGSLSELFDKVKTYFIKNYEHPTIIYEYTKPKYNINCNSFYKHCESGVIQE